jgi:hypothetical protein
MASLEDISLEASSPAIALERFVLALHKKYYPDYRQNSPVSGNTAANSRGVVILIDEYDKPIADHGDDPELAKANLSVLRSFYGTIKTVDEYLRFAFVTGATKFAKSGVSSGANQLEDISLDEKYGAICGFTPEELDSLFGDRLEAVLEEIKSRNQPKNINTIDDLKAKIMAWYDGYSWDGATRVLNPLSILKFFENKKFNKYWIQTDPTSFVSKSIHQNPLAYTLDKMKGYARTEMEKTDLGEASPISILFQRGYLTVDQVVYDDETELEKYSFRLPNLDLDLEVADAVSIPLKKALFDLMAHNKSDVILCFKAAILARDIADLETIIGSLFKGITSHQRIECEKFYHSLFQACVYMMNLHFSPEASSYIGRSDLDIFLEGDIYAIIELKFEKGKPLDDQAQKDSLLDKAAGAALEQIKANDYGGHYKSRASEIIEMGLGVYREGLVRVKFGH